MAPTPRSDRAGFGADLQFARSVGRCWMLDRYQWEAVQLLLKRMVVVLDLLERCGLGLYYEDGQAVGLRHESGAIIRPFAGDREGVRHE